MAFFFFDKRNDALALNPPTGVDEHITTHGSDFYWAICAAMGVSAMVVAGMMFRKPQGERVFHYLSISLLLTACVAYFTMASDLGWAPVVNEFMRTKANVRGTTRQVFYARYIDWVITTPLLLLDILLTAGLPWSTILFTLFMDEVMIITGLIGALVTSRYKWGYWTLGCIAMFFVFYNIAFVARKSAKAIGDDVHKLFLSLSGLTILLWTLYPLAWGLCEGGNYITADSEAVFYGILDFLAKPVFTAILIIGHSKLDYARFGLSAHSARESALLMKEEAGSPGTTTTGTRVGHNQSSI